MSTPTMRDRAAAYLIEVTTAVSEKNWQWGTSVSRTAWIERHLAAFAASEVARVREIQRPHLGELAVGARVVASAKVRHNLTVAVLALDAATRPDAPLAKAKDARTAKSCVVGPTCDHCAEDGPDVNHKPVDPAALGIHRRGCKCSDCYSSAIGNATHRPIKRGRRLTMQPNITVTATPAAKFDSTLPKSTGLSALAKQVKKGRR